MRILRDRGAAIGTVAVIGNYGNRNLGDEATLAAIVHHVRRRWPHARILGLSLDPADTRVRHGIEAVPSRRPSGSLAPDRSSRPTFAPPRESGLFVRLRRRVAPRVRQHRLPHLVARSVVAVVGSVRDALKELPFVVTSLGRLRGLDLLIVGGGGQLTDEVYPSLLLRWSVLARLRGARLAVVNVGAGPLDSPWKRLLIRCVLYLADYRAYRDERSKHLIETIGVSRPGPVFPDVVYSLPVTGAVRQMGAADDSRVIGVNVFPRQDPRYVSDGDPEAYRAYLGTLGAFVAWLLRAGYIVLLFPTQLRADTLVMEDLKKTIRDDVQGLEHRLVEPRIETVEDLVSHVATTALVVATRFHGILISFLLGKPVLALSDQPKMDDLVEDMGLSDYLLSLDRFDVESMIERFKSLEANREILTARIQRRAREHRRALEGQFDSLLENGIGGR